MGAKKQRHSSGPKEAASAFIPPGAKVPRVDPNKLSSSSNQRPAWRFGCIDMGGRWGWHLAAPDARQNVYEKLRTLEVTHWYDLDRSGSHSVARDRLIRDAQRRLETLKRDDEDEIYSLRLSGKERVWGFRRQNVLEILWWDPNHEVCPATLKHT